MEKIPQPITVKSTGNRTGTEMLNDTVAFWQPVLGRPLTTEDARQIGENVTGFFQLLLAWDAEEQNTGGEGPTGRVRPNAV